MNVSKHDQRFLHILALGGAIHHIRNEGSKVQEVTCYTREGHILTGFTIEDFKRLKNKGLVSSKNGKPYRITTIGAGSARSKMNQR